MVPHRLGPLVEMRNPAAHSSVSAQSNVSLVRENVLGIGKEGIASQLARVKMRGV